MTARAWRRSLIAVAALTLALPAHAQEPPPALTLADAVERALESYPAIRAAHERVLAQESGVSLARTAYLPRFDAGVQVNRATRNNVSGLLLPGLSIPSISGPVLDDTSSSTFWGSAGAVLLSWEAFDFGLRGASVALAQSQVDRAAANADLTRLDVSVAAAGAFLRLAAEEQTVRAAAANVERQRVFSESVAALVRNELRPGADDSRAQAELALARIQLIQAEQAEQVARANLAQWLGTAPSDVRIAAAALLEAPPAPPAAPGGAAAHPLVQAQQAAVESSRALGRVLARSYAPRFDLQSAYSLRGTGVDASGADLGGSEGLDFETENWAVGVTATFPLFGWFGIRERQRIEQHNERAEEATYDRVVEELEAQSERARAELDGARRVAENTPVQLAAARVLEQQARARYEAGLATIVEVSDAQRLLLQAEVGDAVARLSVWRALLAAAAAEGDISELLR